MKTKLDYCLNMITVLLKIKRFFKQALGLFPSAIPTGVEAFEAWAQSLEETYDLPTKDKDSIRFVLSTAIMHTPPTAAYKSKFYFVLLIRAAAAKQIAGAVFHDIKTKQKAAQAAEATAKAVADGQQK